ncbi:MAG: ORF6N domain-containing protein [Saprospirales bacterium]|nr:ORF6N domain-containing protein [Saprospirales bacterium]
MQIQSVQDKIYEIRNQKVMLDFDLAALYEVETKNLNLAVKRNIKRFPLDFMFRLTTTEWQMMRLQIETESQSKRNTNVTPYAFTEQGLAMLSGILNSDKAINVNIAIMRAFVYVRQIALTHKELTEKIKKLESKTNKKFKDVYDALDYLLQKDKLETEQKTRTKIGFKTS